MSTENKTENLKLPQYKPTDVFDLKEVNDGYKEIDRSYKEINDNYNEAIKTSTVSGAIDNLELIDARGGETKLKDRLNKFDSSLETKANLNDTYSKLNTYNKNEIDSKVFSMSNMGQDVKEAMTGGSVAVVGENAVGTVNTKDYAITSVKRTQLGEFATFIPSNNLSKINIDFVNKQISIPSGYIMYRGFRNTVQSTTISYSTDVSSVQYLVYNDSMKGFTTRPNSSAATSYSGQNDLYLCAFVQDKDFVYGIGNIFNINSRTPSNYQNIAYDSTPLFLFTIPAYRQFVLNSTDKTIKISNASIFFRGSRVDIVNKTYTLEDEGTSSIKGLIFNTLTKTLTFRTISSGVLETEIVLLTWQIGTSSIAFNGYAEYYEIDGVEYDCRKKYDTYYVSTSGRDVNDGLTRLTPFATLTKALENKPKNIIVSPGQYFIKGAGDFVNIDGYEELNISMDLEGSKDGDIVWLCGQNGIGGLTLNGDNLLTKTFEITDINSRFYKVFISKELTPIDIGERSNGTNACLWESYSDYAKDIKILPVLTYNECKNNKGTFYCDGTSIFINPTSSKDDTVIYRYSRLDGSVFNFNNIKKLKMSNIKCTHSHGTVAIFNKVDDYKLHNCEFSYSALGEGLQPYRSNGNAYKCVARKNRNDGFNIQTYGDTHFFDCEGMYNYDDGLSHHTGCTGSVIGGEYYNNGKGGVSPAHGAEVDIYNAICHNNYVGIYSSCSSDKPVGKRVRHVNNVCYGNRIGLIVSNYNVLSYNCKYDDNEEPIRVTDNVNTSYNIL